MISVVFLLKLNFSNHHCAIDSLEDTELCDPSDVAYEIDVTKAYFGGVYTSCKSHNDGDDCAVHTCCCETQFVKSLLELFFGGYTFDDAYAHDVWDHQANCGNTGVGRSSVECCGNYPFRVPYNELTNTDCCMDEKLFDTGVSDCCMDGSIRSKGNCPESKMVWENF